MTTNFWSVLAAHTNARRAAISCSSTCKLCYHAWTPRYVAIGSTRRPAETVYIATTDYAASVLIPTVLERIANAAPSLRIEVVPWNDRVFNEMEAGRIHLALIGVHPPESFESEALFSDEFVCVVAEDHPLRASRLTLKRYVEYGHAVVAIGRDGTQPWIERALAANGFERRVAYRSPYQLSAILAASRTNMICTTARRLAKQLAPIANVRLLAAPRELPKISYRMGLAPTAARRCGTQLATRSTFDSRQRSLSVNRCHFTLSH